MKIRSILNSTLLWILSKFQMDLSTKREGMNWFYWSKSFTVCWILRVVQNILKNQLQVSDPNKNWLRSTQDSHLYCVEVLSYGFFLKWELHFFMQQFTKLLQSSSKFKLSAVISLGIIHFSFIFIHFIFKTFSRFKIAIASNRFDWRTQ